MSHQLADRQGSQGTTPIDDCDRTTHDECDWDVGLRKSLREELASGADHRRQSEHPT